MSLHLRHLVDSAAAFFEWQWRKTRLLSPGTDEEHLDAAIAWLARGQDACNGCGVSILFNPQTGWAPDPYPETSGYILATFLKYAELAGKREYFERAVRLGDWEIDIQRADGAVLSSVRRDLVRVFNTGQVVLGWCSLFESTGDTRYLRASISAATWLQGIQERDGSWVRDTYCGPRTYHARVAWALLRVFELSADESFARSAWRNIGWVLRQQNSAGWFSRCGFDSAPPITHVIGYTMRGLLESYVIATRTGAVAAPAHLLPAILRTSQAVVRSIRRYRVGGITGMLPSAFTETWQPPRGSTDSCLTGNAQLAICLLRLTIITGDSEYADAAFLLIDALKNLHDRLNPNDGVRGGVAGSFPFRRGYLPQQYPNWAAKFFADSLLMRIQLADGTWVKA